MKAVNVDDVLKILHKYGKYIFVTDEKKYSDMVDEIANLKVLKQEPILEKIRSEIETEKNAGGHTWYVGGLDFALSIINKYMAESEG